MKQRLLSWGAGAALVWFAAVNTGRGVETWERVGVVGSDSGQVMIMDPCYVDSEWVREGEGADWAVEFWGRDEKAVAGEFGSSPVKCADEEAATAEAKRIALHCKEHELAVQLRIRSGSTYEICCDLTLAAPGHGQLVYRSGNEGLGVVSQTVYGDGTFPVYARRDEKGVIVELRVLFDENGAEAKRLLEVIEAQKRRNAEGK